MVIHDESRTSLAGEIGPDPLQEDGQTETRGGQELEVDGCPSKPRTEAAHSHLVTLQNCKALAHHRHVSFVEVTKRTRRRVAGNAAANHSSGITSLLHCDLRNTGKRLALFL